MFRSRFRYMINFNYRFLKINLASIAKRAPSKRECFVPIAGSFLVRGTSTKLSVRAIAKLPRVTRRLANNIGAKVTTTCVAPLPPSSNNENFHASRAHWASLRGKTATVCDSRTRLGAFPESEIDIADIIRIYHALIRMQQVEPLTSSLLLSLISSHKSRSSDAQLTVCRWFCIQITCVKCHGKDDE